MLLFAIYDELIVSARKIVVFDGDHPVTNSNTFAGQKCIVLYSTFDVTYP